MLKELKPIRNAAALADFTSEKAAKNPDADCIMLINTTTGELEKIIPDLKKNPLRSKQKEAGTTPKSDKPLGAQPKTKSADKSPKENSSKVTRLGG